MPPRNPLVSIVVPANNAERFLPTSLDSIIGQTYSATEILLMDDGSTDRTESTARSYGDRITYYRQPRNRGQFANVSDGISRARGEYIAVFHADDEYFPEIIARQAAFLQSHPEAGAVFAIEIFFDAEGRERERLTLPGEVRGRELLDSVRFSTQWSRTLRSWTNIWPPARRALATKESLAAHEAHRSEDAVMRAVNCYILNRSADLNRILKEISLARILASPKEQRYRLSVLFCLLRLLAPMPHLALAARLFRKRWHARVDEAMFQKVARRKIQAGSVLEV